VTLAVHASKLSRSFGDVVAVTEVDLEIAPGETYGFLGPNGAGKTTCVRMLATLLRPTSGTASVAGFDVAKDAAEVRFRIGVALQATAVDPKQTGREFLDLQARLYGLGRSQRRDRITQLAEMVDLGDALDRRIGTYSGGMARRIDLAGALVHQPAVVFLDEPTTGLDPASRLSVWEEIQRLNRDYGTTVFLTTQYLEEADVLARRVGIIDQGKIVAEGTPDALKKSIGSDMVIAEIGTAGDDAFAALDGLDGVQHVEVIGTELLATTHDGAQTIGAIAVALHQQDVPVGALTLRRPTLDDVFLELTGARMAAEEATEEAVV
jgi:ABC-2 type transport system ATP-binding protein